MIQHSLKQLLQRRRNIFISICMVCCRRISADGRERSVTWQLPSCHMGKSQTQSCSIFHLLKCKAATQPAGGRHGKGSRLIPSSSQHRVVTHVRLCLSYQAPEDFVTSQWGDLWLQCLCTKHPCKEAISILPKAATAKMVLDFATLAANRKCSFAPVGFASLVTRCCFSLCWKHRTTTAKKKPQADK